ncbi:MAG: hypothetical protein RL567_1, partial [Bacteroidota bacterium]
NGTDGDDDFLHASDYQFQKYEM